VLVALFGGERWRRSRRDRWWWRGGSLWFQRGRWFRVGIVEVEREVVPVLGKSGFFLGESLLNGLGKVKAGGSCKGAPKS
jgi:hypothetical protein